MEQLKVALAWIKQHHFWLLCGFVALVGAGSWYMASTALATEFDKNSKTIKSELDSSGRLRSQPYHASQPINEKQLAENQRLAENVRELWASLYNRQREEVLRWPEQLGDDFVRLVERQQFGDPIPNSLRRRYQNYIENFYPELPKIVDAEESQGDRRSGSRRSRGGGVSGIDGIGGISGRGTRSDRDREEEKQHLVNWVDQDNIRNELYLEQTPSTVRIWATQEDLWVYVTLLRAIAAVNDAAGSDRYSNAAVRDINALLVGRLAAEERASPDRLFTPDVEGGGFGGGGGSIGGISLDDSFGAGSGGDFGGEGESDEALLLANRYLDDEGQPMPVTEGDYSYGREYKRLPVKLELRMDQRWLTHLISELSNAPLTVEVTEVRINPESSGRGGRSRGRSSTTRRSSRSRGDSESFDPEPNVVDLAMRGIVYIYNPVDEEALKVGDDA